MYSENISRYVSLGFNIETEKFYRKICFGPLLLLIFIPVVHGSVWSYLLAAMFLISIACVITAFKVSSGGLTLKEALWLDVVISVNWVLVLSYSVIKIFTMWQGFTPWLLLLCLPVVLVPLIVGIIIYISLKGENYNPKQATKAGIAPIGMISGLLGWRIAKILGRHADQSTALIVVLICLCLINSVMSLGLLSLQKLYFIKKYHL